MHLKYLFSQTLIELHFALTYVVYLREKNKTGNTGSQKDMPLGSVLSV